MSERQLGAAGDGLEVNFDAPRYVGLGALPRPDHPRRRFEREDLAIDPSAASRYWLMAEAETLADHRLKVILHQPDLERGTIVHRRPDFFDRMRKKFPEEQIDL